MFDGTTIVAGLVGIVPLAGRVIRGGSSGYTGKRPAKTNYAKESDKS